MNSYWNVERWSRGLPDIHLSLQNAALTDVQTPSADYLRGMSIMRLWLRPNHTACYSGADLTP